MEPNAIILVGTVADDGYKLLDVNQIGGRDVSTSDVFEKLEGKRVRIIVEVL